MSLFFYAENGSVYVQSASLVLVVRLFFLLMSLNFVQDAIIVFRTARE